MVLKSPNEKMIIPMTIWNIPPIIPKRNAVDWEL